MTPEQFAEAVTAVVLAATPLASAFTVLFTFVVRQFVPVAGSWARFVVWGVSLLISIYCSATLGFWPQLGWATATAAAESLGLIITFAMLVVAVSQKLYDAMNLKSWRTASDRQGQG